MEPCWEEALDVDDSDLQSSSLLRPCKQQRRRDQTNPATVALDSSPSPSQVVDCHAKVIPPVRIIPGPSGIVQAAKLRKARDNERFLSQEEHCSPMATQEYIRRAVEDPAEDADFQSNPWLSAIEFVSGDGMSNCVTSAPLGDMKKHLKNGKLDQVVAVIKSCAPNTLGDLTVVLKDPTGTVSGTIHHKVLTEHEFGNDILVGSVLILHKVSVFSPSRAAHYLNITMRNLVKVFYKDIGPSTKDTFQAPGGGGLCTLRASENSGRRPIEGERLLGNLKYASDLVDNQNKGTNPVHVDVEPTALNKVIRSLQKDTFQAPDLVDNRNKNTNPVNASLPCWTDEQLNELLDGVFEDDM